MNSGPPLAQRLQTEASGEEYPRKVKLTFILGSLRDAGTERHALELLTHLDREKFSISLMLFDGGETAKVPADVRISTVLRIPQESSKWLSGAVPWAMAMGKMHAQFVARRPDIVHAFLPGPSILGVVPARLARVPVFIGSRRSLIADYRRDRHLAALTDTVALKLAHLNLGNSLAVSDEMISVGGCPPNKCQTICNGVDTIRFHPGGSRGWRTGLGWDDTNVVFGIVANFHACKKHVDFVRAAALIIKCRPQARFLMVGADYGQKEMIAREVIRLGLSSKMKLWDSDPIPERIFPGIDVLVCPSETEGSPNVVLEAMACGKPIIATRVGGIPELVQEGETGFLVAPGSPQAIADAADKLIVDPERQKAMGKRGRQRAVQHFSLERMVQSHERLYLSLFAQRRRTAA